MADQAIYSPQRVLDENGDPVAGAKVTFYAAGTLTLIDVWQDAAGSIASTNPVVADADGNLPQRFVGEAAKVVITDANDATLRTIDPVPVSLTSAGGAALVTFAPTANIPAANVQAAIVMVDDNARSREAALGTPLRVDAAQGLSGGEQTQGRSNLGLGTLATVSPTGTPNGKRYLGDDNTWKDLPGWTRVASVAVNGSGAVLVTGLDAAKSYILSMPRGRASTTVSVRMRFSNDGGSTFGPYITLINSGNWNVALFQSAIELTPTDVGVAWQLLTFCLTAANFERIYPRGIHYDPGTSTLLCPVDYDSVEFSTSSGTFVDPSAGPAGAIEVFERD